MRRTKKDDKQAERSGSITVGDLRLDCESRRVFINDKEVNLTAKEFDVLELLVKNPNKVYSRENLLNLVWGYEYPGDVRTVDVHIRRLREKIEETPSAVSYTHLDVYKRQLCTWISRDRECFLLSAAVKRKKPRDVSWIVKSVTSSMDSPWDFFGVFSFWVKRSFI